MSPGHYASLSGSTRTPPGRPWEALPSPLVVALRGHEPPVVTGCYPGRPRSDGEVRPPRATGGATRLLAPDETACSASGTVPGRQNLGRGRGLFWSAGVRERCVQKGRPAGPLVSRSVNRAPGGGLRAGWAVSGGAAGADHGQNVADPAPDQGRYPDEQAQPQLEGVVDDEGKRDEADAAAEGEAG